MVWCGVVEGSSEAGVCGGVRPLGPGNRGQSLGGAGDVRLRIGRLLRKNA